MIYAGLSIPTPQKKERKKKKRKKKRKEKKVILEWKWKKVTDYVMRESGVWSKRRFVEPH